MPFCKSEHALARVPTCDTTTATGMRHFGEFLSNCDVVSPICPLMLQKSPAHGSMIGGKCQNPPHLLNRDLLENLVSDFLRGASGVEVVEDALHDHPSSLDHRCAATSSGNALHVWAIRPVDQWRWLLRYGNAGIFTPGTISRLRCSRRVALSARVG